LRRTVSTPHSSGFASLDLEHFSKPSFSTLFTDSSGFAVENGALHRHWRSPAATMALRHRNRMPGDTANYAWPVSLWQTPVTPSSDVVTG
jgi:hypothetical protein